MKRSFVSALVALALITSACSREEQSEPRRTTTTEAATTDGDQNPTTTTTEPPQRSNAVFGQPFTWNDGLQITVSPPEEFRPKGSLPEDLGPTYLKVVVRVVNGSRSNYEPLLSFRVLRPGAEGPTIFLTDAGDAGFPAATIAPGEEVAFSIGFEVTNATGLVLEVAPGVAYPPATFAA